MELIPPHLICIHGAWHGGWCWRDLKERWAERGRTIVTPDLPGHGGDRRAAGSLRLADYADAIADEMDRLQGGCIIAGHSMAGMPISLAAERRPEKVLALVYISAILPRDGQCLFDLSRQDRESMLRAKLVLAPDGMTIGVAQQEDLRECFYHLCSEEQIGYAVSRLSPEPVPPLNDPVRLSAKNYGSVPRFYIECLQDRAVSPSLQRMMRAASPCKRVFTIDTDHSPFFSSVPELVECLDAVEREIVADGGVQDQAAWPGPRRENAAR